MRHLLTCAVVLVLAAIEAWPQASYPSMGMCTGCSPKEVVEMFWKEETAGDLMTPQNWRRYSRGLWAEPPRVVIQNKIFVIFNDWAADELLPRKGNAAEVEVNFEGVGWIDSALRFTRPKAEDGVFSAAEKASITYKVDFIQTYATTTFEDGTSVHHPVGMEWRIRDVHPARFMTVNAAIRYVLQSRDKTKDPAIKKNADQTLAILLRLPNG